MIATSISYTQSKRSYLGRIDIYNRGIFAGKCLDTITSKKFYNRYLYLSHQAANTQPQPI